MNWLLVITLVFAVTLLSVESRRCQYVDIWHYGQECQKQCCGKEDDMQCLDSCTNISCSGNDDCGKGCCDGRFCVPDSSECEKEKSYIVIITVVVLCVIILLIVLATVLCVWCCRRTRQQPGMVLLVSQ